MSRGLPLMIFAAGFGTRMGALTRDRPKPLLDLAGRSLIERAVDMGRGAGCAPIIANTHYLADRLDPVLGELGVGVSHETPDILDTGGGLRAALDRLGGDRVATLNPDVAWAGPNPLSLLLTTPWPKTAGALLMLVPRDAARGYGGTGDFDLAPDGRVTRGGAYVYSGAQIVAADAVRRVPDRVFSLNRAWSALAEQGRLFGTVYPGAWCDAGTPEGLAEAAGMIAAVRE